MSETMSETNGNKLLFCRDSEAAFGIESATRGGSFWTELDWGKPWRGQVFGELEAAFGSESTKAVAGSGVRRSRSGVW